MLSDINLCYLHIGECITDGDLFQSEKCLFGSRSKCANPSDYCPLGRWFFCHRKMRMKATLSAPLSMMQGRSAGSLKSSYKVLILNSAQWRGSGVSFETGKVMGLSYCFFSPTINRRWRHSSYSGKNVSRGVALSCAWTSSTHVGLDQGWRQTQLQRWHLSYPPYW